MLTLLQYNYFNITQIKITKCYETEFKYYSKNILNYEVVISTLIEYNFEMTN